MPEYLHETRERKSVKRKILTFAVMLGLTIVKTSAAIILSDAFNYPDGPLVNVSSGKWATHSGTPGQLTVVNGHILLCQTNSEDVNAYLDGYPYSTNSGSVLYAKFTVRFISPAQGDGNYFAHFKDAGHANYECRVWVSTNNAASGRFRLGISNWSPTGGDQLPYDLTTN